VLAPVTRTEVERDDLCSIGQPRARLWDDRDQCLIHPSLHWQRRCMESLSGAHLGAVLPVPRPSGDMQPRPDPGAEQFDFSLPIWVPSLGKSTIPKAPTRRQPFLEEGYRPLTTGEAPEG